MTSELIQELAQLSIDHQQELVVADEAGEEIETAYQRLRLKYQEKYMEIIRRDRNAPAFPIPFPSIHGKPDQC